MIQPSPFIHQAALSSKQNAAYGVVANCLVVPSALLLPYFLVRALSTHDFALWQLCYQVLPLVMPFSVGLASIVGNEVARYASTHQNLNQSLGHILHVGLYWVVRMWFVAVLCVVLTGAVVALGASYWLGSHSVQAISTQPNTLQHHTADTAQLWFSWVLVGLGASVAVVLSVFHGFYAGLGRNHYESVYRTVYGMCWLLVLVLIWWFRPAQLWHVALSYALLCVGLGVIYLGFFTKWVIGGRYLMPLLDVRKLATPTLMQLSAAFKLQMRGNAVWLLCGVVAVCFNLSIVAGIDFVAVGGYGVAMALSNVLVVFVGAVFSPLQTRLAALLQAAEVEQNQYDFFRSEFARFQRYLLVFLLGACIATAFFVADPFGFGFRDLWIRYLREHAHTCLSVLPWLVLASSVRLSTTLLSFVIAAAKKQDSVVVPSIFDAVSVVLLGLILGQVFGVMGVAYANVIAACLAWVLNFLFFSTKIKKFAFISKYHLIGINIK